MRSRRTLDLIKCRELLSGFSLVSCTIILLLACAFLLCACTAQEVTNETDGLEMEEPALTEEELAQLERERQAEQADLEAQVREAAINDAKAKLDISEDYRDSFLHGSKTAEFQKYIMLHDTEGTTDASSVVNWWDSNGNGVAAHFVVNTDGSIVQCVPLDNITHHAGYGDAGHNDMYGLVEDGRDDMVGAVPIGSWAPDYGMNAYSIGIEMVHVGGSGDYPDAQLDAVDNLIAYIDAYYGFESEIVDHKAWRTGNSDTSPEFAQYLANYQLHRTHL